MSTENQKLDTCGCCEGLRALTPALVKNLPGLAAIAYRVGTHGSFKVTMQSQLSAQRSLRALTTRDDNDPAIGLIDGWAAVADVLTFYQERIANEGYLGTATERRSILELARLIGYELNPGVAASTYLAFTIEQAQISPAMTNSALTIGQVPSSPSATKISIGTKAQSVPGQDELPQVFETIEEIEARGEWSELRPQLKRMEIPGFKDKEVYLKGISTGLKPGDGLLMIGAEREADAGSERWDFRRITEVETDQERDITKATWDEGLGWQIFSRIVLPAKRDFRVFVMRQQAFLFGHNAPDWRILSDEVRDRYLGTAGASELDMNDEWPNGFDIASISGYPDADPIEEIYLDALYPQIVKGGWLVLVAPAPRFYVEVYEVTDAVESSRKNFTLTAKTTAVTLKGENLRQKFNDRVRETVVFAQNEELEIAEKPVTDPVEGSSIVLEKLLPDLEEKRRIIVSGKRMRAKIRSSARWLRLTSTDDSKTVQLSPNDSLAVMKTPEALLSGEQKWTLKDKNGFVGTVTTKPGRIDIIPAEKEDEIVSEINIIDAIEPDSNPTVINLAQNLSNSFDRSTVVIYANVARATHGEAKVEMLGSGDGSQKFQEFVLKQNPITFVAASTPKGAETTLKVRVNDVLWKEVPTFFGHGPDERIYITRMDDDGKTKVVFGDGKTGARLPSGQENVKAEYRKGIGLSGLMKARQISQLMTRPLGVKEVVNPLAATGADDPEKRDNARQNAPLTVLTLDRIVSLQDFEDFARAFAGIGKAQATMLWNGEQRTVHITVSAAGGRPVEKGSELYKKFIEGIDAARHADHQVMVGSYDQLPFNVRARVHVDRNLVVEDVMDSVMQAIRRAFSFDMRNFGQAVTKSEVMAVIQRVAGVIALDLEDLYFSSHDPELRPFLPAHTARWDEQNVSVEAAELITVNASGIILEEMKV